MKLLILCHVLTTIGLANADYLSEFTNELNRVISQLININNVVIAFEPLPVKDNVWFYVATREMPILTLLKPGELLADRNIDASKPLIIWSHGYVDNGLSPWMQEAGNKTLEDRDVIFIAIDWHPNAKLFYPLSAAITKAIGTYVGEFLSTLAQTQGLDPSLIICVGHSLGAHICGFIGKTVQNLTGKIMDKIFGLDPAGPSFNGITTNGIAPCEDRLCITDAQKVIAIHTNRGVFGIGTNIGSGDFWLTACSVLGVPFRSYIQSDCALMLIPGAIDVCCHRRAYEFFTQTISKPVAGYKCVTNICVYSISPQIQINGYNTDFTGVYHGSAAGRSLNFMQCN